MIGRKVLVEHPAARITLEVAVFNYQDLCIRIAKHMVGYLAVSLLSTENRPRSSICDVTYVDTGLR